jgi:hypothetical protein
MIALIMSAWSASTAVAAVGCQDTLTVGDLGDSGGARQLRAAIASVCPGGIISIAPGTVHLTNGPLVLTNDATLIGLGSPPQAGSAAVGKNPQITVIDAGQLSRVLVIQGADVVLDSVTITGGSATDGAGILNLSGRVVLNDALITGNSATNGGGGIHNDGTVNGPAFLSLNGSSAVTANSATLNGGGILNTSGGAPATVELNESSSVTGNQTPGNGGGIVNNSQAGGNAFVTLNDNALVAGNTGTANGGGIVNASSANQAILTVNDSASVTGNSSPRTTPFVADGGGIFNISFQGGTATTTLNGNVTIADNSSGGFGGGLANIGFAGPAHLTLNNSVRVTGNRAGQGGGIMSAQNATVTLRNNATVTANTVPFVGNGGGIFNFSPSIITLLDSSSVIGNTPDNCVGC